MKTVSQLLLSPISGDDIVLGRWAAALLQGSAVAAPWVVSFVVCALVASQGQALTPLFSYGVWIVSLALVLSAGRAGTLRELSGRQGWLSPNRASLAWFFGQLLFLYKVVFNTVSSETVGPTMARFLMLVNAVAVAMLLGWSGKLIDDHRARMAEAGGV
jgi:ABC-type Na+ efflux pump permease subunit